MNRGLTYVLLLGNMAALFGVFGMIFWLVLGALGLGPRLVGIASALPHPAGFAITADTALLMTLMAAGCLAFVIAALWLVGVTKRLSHQSIWAHEHFSGATLAQFLYVAAQSGIFSFLINYMTSEPPSLPSSWLKPSTSNWVEVRTAFAGSDFKDVSALAAKLTAKADPLSAYLATSLSSSTLQTLARYKEGTASETSARVALMQDLNSLILKKNLYSPERFSGIALQEKTRQMLAQDPNTRNEPRLNRLLLADAYPKELAYQDGVAGRHEPLCRQPGVLWLRVLSAGPCQWRRLAAAILRAQDRGPIFGVERGDLLPDLPEVRLALGRVRLPELLLHVHHVPDHLCPGHLRSGRAGERRLGLHRHGHRRRRSAAQGDGGRGRPLQHVPRLHCATDLFRSDRPLRLRLAQAQPRRGAARSRRLRRALSHFWSESLHFMIRRTRETDAGSAESLCKQ